MKIKTWRIMLFAAVLVLCAGVNLAQITGNRFTMGQPLSLGGKNFVAQLYFPGGYGAIAFDSPEAVVRFARLPNVEIIKKVVKMARGDVVVEALE